jgi:hypothetical protein
MSANQSQKKLKVRVFQVWLLPISMMLCYGQSHGAIYHPVILTDAS